MPDLTALEVTLDERIILAISVYIPPKTPDDCFKDSVSMIRAAISSVVMTSSKEIEIINAGDFNRHDPLWGGSKADLPRYRKEAEEIIDMMADLSLQSLLPPGTITFEGPQGSSTIDLILASPRLVDDRIKCFTSLNDHGSDHRAIETVFNITLGSNCSKS